MTPKRKCTLCGRELENPSRATVCSRCLLQDVQNLLSDDNPLDLDGDPGTVRELGRSLPHATTEPPGRYTNVREHARGGMGRVLLVHDEQLGRDIIVKELLGDKRAGSGEPRLNGRAGKPMSLAGRFVREARVTGQLEHPSIVPVYELGYREDGTLYYTMKYVRGISLAQAIEQAPSLEERLKLLPHVLDACQAIAYAHSRGVLHRDHSRNRSSPPRRDDPPRRHTRLGDERDRPIPGSSISQCFQTGRPHRCRGPRGGGTR